jgi:hypothetical protein
MVYYKVMILKYKRSYWTSSITVFALWGVIFLVHWAIGSPPHPKTLAPIFLGFFMGWLGATIAIKVNE